MGGEHDGSAPQTMIFFANPPSKEMPPIEHCHLKMINDSLPLLIWLTFFCTIQNIFYELGCRCCWS